eukprot:10955886-Alexandrium_andersonii.AAC.1
MSASLVGSEMCIRDSSRAPRGELPGVSAFRLMLLFGQPPGPIGVLEPVSYTHLTLPTICSV